jgi:hypothetical protein
MAKRGWKRPFDDPTPLPRGRQFVTLEDAAAYIMKLPKGDTSGDAADAFWLGRVSGDAATTENES